MASCCSRARFVDAGGRDYEERRGKDMAGTQSAAPRPAAPASHGVQHEAEERGGLQINFPRPLGSSSSFDHPCCVQDAAARSCLLILLVNLSRLLTPSLEAVRVPGGRPDGSSGRHGPRVLSIHPGSPTFPGFSSWRCTIPD